MKKIRKRYSKRGLSMKIMLTDENGKRIVRINK